MGSSAGPVPFQILSKSHGSWSTGLFECQKDVGNCCMTFFCPCVTFGRIAEIVDRGSISCCASGSLYALIMWFGFGFQFLYSCCYRSKMRGDFTLEEKPCADWLVHGCCEICALCQEYRELENRGFDMKLGWQANMERHRATVPPAMERGMNR